MKGQLKWPYCTHHLRPNLYHVAHKFHVYKHFCLQCLHITPCWQCPWRWLHIYLWSQQPLWPLLNNHDPQPKYGCQFTRHRLEIPYSQTQKCYSRTQILSQTPQCQWVGWSRVTLLTYIWMQHNSVIRLDTGRHNCGLPSIYLCHPAKCHTVSSFGHYHLFPTNL